MFPLNLWRLLARCRGRPVGPEHDDLFERDAELPEPLDGTGGSFQHRDDENVERHGGVIRDRAHRQTEKVSFPILEHRDQLEAHLANQQEHEFSGVTRPEDRDPLLHSDRIDEAPAQVLARITIKVERVLHELVRQPRLASHALWGERVDEPIGRDRDAFDVSLAHEALEIEIRQPERHAEATGERSLRNRRLAFERFEQLQISAGLEFHVSGKGWTAAPKAGTPPACGLQRDSTYVHFVNATFMI